MPGGRGWPVRWPGWRLWWGWKKTPCATSADSPPTPGWGSPPALMMSFCVSDSLRCDLRRVDYFLLQLPVNDKNMNSYQRLKRLKNVISASLLFFKLTSEFCHLIKCVSENTRRRLFEITQVLCSQSIDQTSTWGRLTAVITLWIMVFKQSLCSHTGHLDGLQCEQTRSIYIFHALHRY